VGGRTEPPATRVLAHGEQTSGEISVIENRVPAGWPGPPLHTHDFDETFYVLEGELTFQVEDALVTRSPGEVAFAQRGVAHTLANLSAAPARYVLICNPAGFERHFARLAAEAADVEPPGWALQPIPEVTRVGPRIGEAGTDE
jgi:quercetin dioxygenase-like cupin family protein